MAFSPAAGSNTCTIDSSIDGALTQEIYKNGAMVIIIRLNNINIFFMAQLYITLTSTGR
jgi:hypothetical protein